MSDATALKTCTKCKVEQSLDEFSVDKSGYREARCKGCIRAHAREYYAKNLKHKWDTGELTLDCQQCGESFTYVKTTSARRKYCGEQCKANAGEAKRIAREASRVRQCACGSSAVHRVGKSVCKDCRKDDRNRSDSNRRRRLAMYGLTIGQFDEMLSLQNGRCGICYESDPGPRGWHIDHNHGCCPGIGSCGKCVRGLLCHRCNLLLGNARDSAVILEQAINYLAVTSKAVNSLG